MNESKFALRKIRNGRVKIGGRWFVPSERFKKYDGSLDGLVFAFGRYPKFNGSAEYEDFIELWGPEQNYHEPDTDKWEKDPQVQSDGTMPWASWRAV